MKKPNSVDEYMESQSQWTDILEPLREMLLSTGMDEQIKWMFPCYSERGKNVVGIGATKNYVGIWFFQGVLLKDELSVLANAQEGKTKAMRQWHIKGKNELDTKNIEAYVYEAIENQRAGLEIKPDTKKEIIIPVELEDAFSKNGRLKTAFEVLSKTNRRDFAEHIGGAKKEDTRIRRLEKSIPMILEGYWVE